MLIALAIVLLPLLAFATTPTGIQNHDSTCYLNSLLACLYDAPSFRQAVYANFDMNNVMSALASVFARKQLNNLPSLDLTFDMVATISDQIAGIEMGAFNDIDEMFRLLSNFFPRPVLDSIGVVTVERTFADDGVYLINEAEPTHHPFITIRLPSETKQKHNLQELLNTQLFSVDHRLYQIYPNEHFEYYMARQFDPTKESASIIAQISSQIISHSDIFPVFLTRNAVYNARRPEGTARSDEVEVPEHLNLQGIPFQYMLFSFAVFIPGHYHAYVRSMADLKWYSHNDATVHEVKPKDFFKDLKTKAVLLFYMRADRLAQPEVPPVLNFFAQQMNMRQHMQAELIPQVKRLSKSKSKSKDKKKK